MSTLAYNSNNKIKKSGILFYGKGLYRREVRSQPVGNYIDLWHAKPFYGKVDTEFNLVHPNASNLKSVRGTGGREDIYALNFVADAFNAMAVYIQDLNIKKKILPSSFFSPLEAHKAWQGTNELYRAHMQGLYDLFVNNYIRHRASSLARRIKTFKDFLPVFKDFLNFATEGGAPFTKSGFLSGLACPHMTSGLMIEIAKEVDASDDSKKYIKYFSNSRNLNMYSDITTKFGFLIDMNMPWRLVADLDSPAWLDNPILKNIVDNYFEEGYTIQKVFDQFYHKPHETDIESFKVFVLQFYNSLIKEEPTFTVPRVCKAVVGLRTSFGPGKEVFQQVIERRSITEREMSLKYNDLFWLKLYFRLRAREMQKDFSEHDMKHDIKHIENIYNVGGYDKAKDYISEILAEYLGEQTSKLNALRLKGKNLLTGGPGPDIIL